MAATKDFILSEIRRLAIQNGGTPPGVKAFHSATGIRVGAWRGRHWVTWGDALKEAGYSPNAWGQSIPNDEIFRQLADYALELGRFPVDAELQMRKRKDPRFPSTRVFYERFGGLQPTALALLQHAKEIQDERLVQICEARIASNKRQSASTSDKAMTTGVVYLIKSGSYYKIGLSNDSGRRSYELKIQLPEKTTMIHEIKTDSAAALERYWHERFAERRKNGEWFELNAADIKAFKSRNQFRFSDIFP